jgi:death-on-curing family protein
MSDIVIYKDGEIELQSRFDGENIWLRQDEIAKLFGKDRTVITRHINNILKDKEVDEKSNVQKMHFANSDKPVKLYSLDIILAVGYRTNSSKAIKFRKWATKVLKEYITKGYALNQKRIQERFIEFEKEIELLTKVIKTQELKEIEAKGFLEIITKYTKSWILLNRFDEQSLKLPTGKEAKFILDYDEAKEAIQELKKELISKKEATEIFGIERENSFKGIIRNIYQTFGGVDLLPTIEEKASNLFYYIVKDHPFADGNKRIGSFMFVLFLSKNNYLYNKNGELKINENALVSLALLIATSKPDEKDLIIKLICNLINEEQNGRD